MAKSVTPPTTVVHLSEYFAGRSAGVRCRWRPWDFFIEHGIELRLGEAVATIDREAHGWYGTPRGMKSTGINWCWRPARIPCSANPR
ncbi:hypothetical protein LNP74_28690 [Klebsiella pneumoniae subsp. pneumoniae]|nr:hypothetical protein [Klebsiella pneumoniae subsp. pneumoniae]